MNHGVDLLRLLEPAVRPVSPTGGVGRAGALPFESQGFDELLRAAEAEDVTAGDPRGLFAEAANTNRLEISSVSGFPEESGGTAFAEGMTDVRAGALQAGRSSDLLTSLADVTRIENTSLRAMIARAAAQTVE